MLRLIDYKKAAQASSWLVGGRLLGVAWTSALVASVGLAGYGSYAIGYSMSAMIVGFADSPWYVRSVRVDESDYLADRNWRAVFAFALSLLAAFVWQYSFVFGLAVMTAAGEIGLGVIKSSYRRRGEVQREMALDTARQALSIGTAIVPMVLLDATISQVSFLYCVPYLICVMVSLAYIRRVERGTHKISIGEFFALAASAIFGAAYAQGDVVLLGYLASPEAAGIYSLASLVAWALAMPMLQYVNSYAASLRQDSAALVSTLRGKRVVAISGGLAFLCAAAAVPTMFLLPGSQLATVLAILAVFVLFRSWNHAQTVELTFRRLDGFRARAAIAVTIVNLILLYLLLGLNAVGAAVAASLAEVFLFLTYFLMLRRLSQPRQKV
jgi:O-antigen/teichoic acid export membrane protein